jgi:hypothetical protein
MGRRRSDYDLEVDHERSRVYLTQYGQLDDETARALLAELDEMTRELPDGWDLVNDLREFAPFEQQKTEYIERGKEIIADNGVRANVRVVDSVITKMQFDRVGDDDEQYHVATAESVEQAERFLDRFEEELDA